MYRLLRGCVYLRWSDRDVSAKFTKQIWFAIDACRYGQLLVAKTEQGVCAVFLSETRGQLLEELHRTFRINKLVELPEFNELEQTKALINKPSACIHMSLDMQGTDFQQQVWQALLAIPIGQTLSYSQLAEKIGKPKAFRAVASACGANKLAVVVPCHRIIGSNGSITGYRWGIERKKEILKYEQFFLQNEQ